MFFGERLKKLRLKSKMTKRQLAAKVGVKEIDITNYEIQKSYPSLNTLVELAAIFNVTTDCLLGVDREKTIDVTGLTVEQIYIVYRVIAEYKKQGQDFFCTK